MREYGRRLLVLGFPYPVINANHKRLESVLEAVLDKNVGMASVGTNGIGTAGDPRSGEGPR